MTSDLDFQLYFNSEDIDFQLVKPESYESWVQRILKNYGFSFQEINFVFCSDSYLLQINKEYLNHDYFTDIISFPLETNPFIGDVYISIDRVRENAVDLKQDFDQELKRVIAHGLLHFLGFNDKSEDEILKMRAEELKAISLFRE